MLGRILSVNPGSLKSLIDEDDYPDRRIVYLMDDTGLKKIRGLNDYQILKTICWTDDDIRKKIENGKQIKFFTIENSKIEAFPATWDNLINLVVKAYPEVAFKVERQRDALKSTSYERIAEQANYDPEKVFKGDPRYMNLNNYRESEGGLVETRLFLLHTLNVNSLYTGDGFTKEKMPEVIAINQRLNTLTDYKIVDLHPQIPHFL